MTKEEFLEEFENLSKEYFLVKQGIKKLSGKEYQDAKYQLQILHMKKLKLESIISFPAYARIQAMSDLEIDEYKKDKIEELELKIKEIKSEKEQGKISSGFAEVRIGGIKEEQKQIKSMTEENLKQHLLKKVEPAYSNYSTFMDIGDSIGSVTQFKGAIVSDPEKARQVANLMSVNATLEEVRKQTIVSSYLEAGAPKELAERLATKSYYYNMETRKHNDEHGLIGIIENFENEIEIRKTKFVEETTEQKLFKLIDTGMEKKDIDTLEFLQQHTNKFRYLDFAELEDLVYRRIKLLKPYFKTKDAKLKIKELDGEIEIKESKLYNEITEWYKDNYDLNFSSLDALKRSIETHKENYDKQKQQTTKFKERFNVINEEVEKKSQDYEDKENIINQQIRSIAGDKYKESDIELYPRGKDPESNLYGLMESNAMAYKKDIATKVAKEAQNQADIKEAELRGITVEQLLQMKKQTQAMPDESMEMPEEEISHGMKR